MRETAVGQAALLGQRHQLLDVRAKFLRLGDGGGDLLVLDERGRHVAEQGGAVARGTLKLTAANAMAHGYFLRSSGGRIRNPRPGGVTGRRQKPSLFAKSGPKPILGPKSSIRGVAPAHWMCTKTAVQTDRPAALNPLTLAAVRLLPAVASRSTCRERARKQHPCARAHVLGVEHLESWVLSGIAPGRRADVGTTDE